MFLRWLNGISLIYLADFLVILHGYLVLMPMNISGQVDTAGWLERTKQDKGPSSLSIVQSRKNLMRAHIVALVLDAEEVSCV